MGWPVAQAGRLDWLAAGLAVGAPAGAPPHRAWPKTATCARPPASAAPLSRLQGQEGSGEHVGLQGREPLWALASQHAQPQPAPANRRSAPTSRGDRPLQGRSAQRAGRLKCIQPSIQQGSHQRRRGPRWPGAAWGRRHGVLRRQAEGGFAAAVRRRPSLLPVCRRALVGAGAAGQQSVQGVHRGLAAGAGRQGVQGPPAKMGRARQLHGASGAGGQCE